MGAARWLSGVIAISDGGMARRRFAARTSWDTGERCLDEHLIYAIHSGQARLESSSGGRVLDAGLVCMIPPGVRFRVRSGPRPPRLTRLRLATQQPWGSEAVVFTVTAELRRVLDLLADRPDSGLAQAAAWDHAAGLLLATALVRALAGRGAIGLVERCRARFAADPSVDPRGLAAACGLSHDWFTRAFRQATGRAPRRWLVEERIRLAVERLSDSDDHAWGVAQGLGWRDPKLFARQFRAVMGETPGRWLRQQRGM